MDKPIPILFTIPNFITAGSGRAMLNIIERLDRSKFSPAVCVQKKGGRLDEEAVKMGIPFIEAPFTFPAKPYFGIFERAKKAAAVFKPYGFKLWHSFNYSDDYTESLVARFAGARYLYTKKNMSWHRNAWYLRSFLASGIAAQNTDMMKDFFSGRLFSGKTELIPRGVDTEKFKIKPEGSYRKSLGISESQTVMTCVAHLVPVKGHETVLKAMAEIPQKISFIIAGEPLDREYAESLHALSRNLKIEDRVYFMGGASDVAALLSETDIFVLPTRHKWRMEGCPVSLLEAMSSSKACIASDIPGSRDIVRDGENGFLFAPEDSAALAAAIQKLVLSKETRERFEKAARETILKSYTIERETRDHERLYLKVLNER